MVRHNLELSKYNVLRNKSEAKEVKMFQDFDQDFDQDFGAHVLGRTTGGGGGGGGAVHSFNILQYEIYHSAPTLYFRCTGTP